MGRFDFIKSNRHKLMNLTVNDIESAESRLGFSFPKELRFFYEDVGYGFIKGNTHMAFNRFIDPDSVADIYLREDIYESDPDLDSFDENDLVFFEINEGLYLTVNRQDSDFDENPVYYFEDKLFDSISEFLSHLDKNPDYLQTI